VTGCQSLKPINMPMTHKNIVTTFTGDIPQFKMFCYCMNKNWKGDKNLSVCLDTGDSVDVFENIAKEIFDSDWIIEICPTIHPYENGNFGNQINLIYRIATSTVHDAIAWDCKCFLLKPADLSTFKQHDEYRIPCQDTTQRLVDMGYDLSGLVDGPIDHYPGMVNLRPNIFNVAQTARYWSALNQRFGHYSRWNKFPVECEYYGYYIFLMQDPDSTIKFFPSSFHTFLCAGGWSFQTPQGMWLEMEKFNQDPHAIVWMHSRRFKDPDYLAVTRSVLLQYDIDSDFVNSVFESSNLVPT